MRSLRLGFATLALQAFLMPLLGPLFDHHFFERMPGHDHLYLGMVAPEHVHLFETQHSHPGEAPHTHEAAPLPQDTPPATEGVVSLSGLNAAVNGLMPPMAPADAGPDWAEAPTGFELSPDQPNLPSLTLIPLEHPPRLLAG